MSSSRIPRGIDSFNTYINNTNTYMLVAIAAAPPNWTRLGWTSSEMGQWTATVALWNPLYAKYSDKKASRTAVITGQLHTIIKNTAQLDKTIHLLDRIASSSVVTAADMTTFHIKKGVLASAASHSHTALTDVVYSGFSALGGGDVQVKCRSAHDSKRPSITDGATCVQYTYLVAPVAVAPAVAVVPTSPLDVSLTKESSTKASFILHAGADNSGKNLYVYFRWYNAKHPELAGPWSVLQTLLIL